MRDRRGSITFLAPIHRGPGCGERWKIVTLACVVGEGGLERMFADYLEAPR